MKIEKIPEGYLLAKKGGNSCELWRKFNGAESFACEAIDELIAERDELRAKIAEMERQEPVAFGLYSGWALKATYLKEHEACEQRDRRQLTADLGGSLEAYRVAPLYALPGAQPAPSVPDGWKLVPIEPTPGMIDAAEYVDWGDADVRGSCINAWNRMLSVAPEAKP